MIYVGLTKGPDFRRSVKLFPKDKYQMRTDIRSRSTHLLLRNSRTQSNNCQSQTQHKSRQQDCWLRCRCHPWRPVDHLHHKYRKLSGSPCRRTRLCRRSCRIGNSSLRRPSRHRCARSRRRCHLARLLVLGALGRICHKEGCKPNSHSCWMLSHTIHRWNSNCRKVCLGRSFLQSQDHSDHRWRHSMSRWALQSSRLTALPG